MKEPPNTCRYIDEVIDRLKDIRDLKLEDIDNRDIARAIDTLEEIRNHNSTLRDMMHEYRDDAESLSDLESVNENLEDDIQQLKSEIQSLNDEVAALTDQVSELENELSAVSA
jgi:predicted RNase H-like nuclease (RuvC/YqgF family)